METLDALRQRLAADFGPEAVTFVPNPSPSGQHSLLVRAAEAEAIARWLRDDPALRLDYCSNVTGLDWPSAGCLETVYHLYSMALRQGPVILRLRTADRTAGTALPSLAGVWRSAELQEREVFDLFGIAFSGHPDLRRLLMWDGFEDHPLRKDYAGGRS